MPGPAFLHGDLVTLAVPTDADLDFLTRTINDPQVRAGMAHARPKSEEAEQGWLDRATDPETDDVHLLICRDGDPVGVIGLDRVTERTGFGELGYFLEPGAWGNSYATDATRTLVAWALQELRLHRIQAKAFESNPASRRVLEKVGFEHEGTLREHWYREGQHEDVHVYGLLAPEL